MIFVTLKRLWQGQFSNHDGLIVLVLLRLYTIACKLYTRDKIKFCLTFQCKSQKLGNAVGRMQIIRVYTIINSGVLYFVVDTLSWENSSAVPIQGFEHLMATETASVQPGFHIHITCKKEFLQSRNVRLFCLFITLFIYLLIYIFIHHYYCFI